MRVLITIPRPFLKCNRKICVPKTFGAKRAKRTFSFVIIFILQKLLAHVALLLRVRYLFFFVVVEKKKIYIQGNLVNERSLTLRYSLNKIPVQTKKP